MIVAVIAADAGKSLVKRSVTRTRPNVLLDEGRYEVSAGGSGEKPEQSFPSGHMAGSVAFSQALSREYPIAGAACGLGSIALGWGRIAKGAHWPLDIAAGGLIGMGVEWLVNLIFTRPARLLNTRR